MEFRRVLFRSVRVLTAKGTLARSVPSSVPVTMISSSLLMSVARAKSTERSPAVRLPMIRATDLWPIARAVSVAACPFTRAAGMVSTYWPWALVMTLSCISPSPTEAPTIGSPFSEVTLPRKTACADTWAVSPRTPTRAARPLMRARYRGVVDMTPIPSRGGRADARRDRGARNERSKGALVGLIIRSFAMTRAPGQGPGFRYRVLSGERCALGTRGFPAAGFPQHGHSITPPVHGACPTFWRPSACSARLRSCCSGAPRQTDTPIRPAACRLDTPREGPEKRLRVAVNALQEVRVVGLVERDRQVHLAAEDAPLVVAVDDVRRAAAARKHGIRGAAVLPDQPAQGAQTVIGEVEPEGPLPEHEVHPGRRAARIGERSERGEAGRIEDVGGEAGGEYRGHQRRVGPERVERVEPGGVVPRGERRLRLDEPRLHPVGHRDGRRLAGVFPLVVVRGEE